MLACPIQKPSPPKPLSKFPSWLKQNPKWLCDYIDVPWEREVRHFNPSIVQWRGELWLATRRAENNPPPFGMNTLVLWNLDQHKRVLNKRPIHYWRTHPKEQFEDPRLVVLSDDLFVSFTNFKVSNYRAHQVLSKIFNPASYYSTIAHILYGKNGVGLNENVGHEKNWVWFDTPKGWAFVYDPWPHHVVITNGGEPAQSFVSEPSACPWEFGQMRGGTPPVLVDGLYWTFFHSSCNDELVGPLRRRYYMGAYAFLPNPPYDIHSMTIEPLLAGSEEDGGSLPCVFPGGAVWQNGKWLVVLGVNDYRSGWISIDHSQLKDRMLTI